MAVVTRSVDYEHDGVALRGYCAWDDSIAGPRPGVLVGHAWAGRSPFEDGKAEWLASLGYVGFALDNYGAGVLGSSAEENEALMTPLVQDRPKLQARLLAALATLKAQPEVDAGRTAIMGFCFGGLCALDLARIDADISAAISIHGLFIPPGNTAASIRSPILVLHGWDDPMAKPDSVLALAEELKAAGADWQLVAYGQTLHAFTNPEANDRSFGTVYSESAEPSITPGD